MVRGLSRWFVLALALSPLVSQAQQARGLYLSVHGTGSPSDSGDPNSLQALYFDIPDGYPDPVYLRIFDAETGGNLDERRGAFDTEVRFVLLGGQSAGRLFGPGHDPATNAGLRFPDADILLDETIGTRARLDMRYWNVRELPLESGLPVAGMRRFVLLVIGLDGNDANHFDYVLSLKPDDKVPPPGVRQFAYELTLRMPDTAGFRTQVRLPVAGRERVTIDTYGLADSEIRITIPFRQESVLRGSPAAGWMSNPVPIPAGTELVGLDVFGNRTRNTFSMVVRDEAGNPLPIPLPIPDYVPIEYPRFGFSTAYPDTSCSLLRFERTGTAGADFRPLRTEWVFGADTLRGETITRVFDRAGHHPFLLRVVGMLNGTEETVEWSDSVRVNAPPVAWGGGNRSYVADRPMAFDGTVSEDPDGRIIRYEWDFGDGNTGVGARYDHVYPAPGLYTVTLKVTDDSGSPCATAVAVSTVRVNRPPVARIRAPGAAKKGDVIRFDGSASTDPEGGELTYWWTINGEEFEGAVVEYLVREDGPIAAVLEVTDEALTANSIARAEHRIGVNRAPIAEAGNDKHVSPGRPATYVGTRSRDTDGRIVKYEWEFPGGVFRDGATVQQGIDEPGWHTVYLRVTDNTGGVGTDSLRVRVNHPPVPVVSGRLFTVDGTVELSAAQSTDADPDGEVIRWEWTMGDGTNKVGRDIRHTYVAPGVYTGSLTIADNSGTFSSIQRTAFTVRVNQGGVAAIEAPAQTGAGDETAFGAVLEGGEAAGWHWDLGDGTAAEGPRVAHRYDRPGTYTVRLTVRHPSGLDEAAARAEHRITVIGAPIALAAAPERVAPHTAFTIDLGGSPGATRFFWLLPDSGWAEGPAARVFEAADEAALRVRFAVDNGLGLANSRTEGVVSVPVNRAPVLSALEPVVSLNRSHRFHAPAASDADADSLRYFWDFGDGHTAEGPVVHHTYAQGGLHTVSLVVDDQQGLPNSTASGSTTVFMNRPPRVETVVPRELRVGQPTEIDASATSDPDGDPLALTWLLNGREIGSGPRFTHTFTQAGRVTIQLRVDDGRLQPNSVTEWSQTLYVHP